MSAETDSDPSQIKRYHRFDLVALALSVILGLAFRLPGLTVFITADEARSWFGRSIIFLDSLLRADLANMAPGGKAAFIENVSLSPAPGVTTMWAGAIGLLLEYTRQGMPGSLSDFLIDIPFDPLDPVILFSLRLPNALLAALAVGLTYWWSRPLLGRWGSLLAAIFIGLDPFYLALSRILGHDALVTTFMWLSLLAFLRVVQQRMQQKTSPRVGQVHHSPFTIHHSLFIILSGAFAGLAFLSKYPALFLGLFIALSTLTIDIFGFGSVERHSVPPPAAQRNPKLVLSKAKVSIILPLLKRWFVDMAIWSAAAAAVFVLFWPAMWVDPLGPVTAIVNDALRASGSSHQKGSFFLGQPVSDPGTLFYPLIILLRTTPVILVGFLLSLGGFFGIWRRYNAGEQRSGGAGEQGSGGAGERRSRGAGEPRSQKKTARYKRRTLYYVFLILLAYTLLYTLLVTYGGKKQDRYILPAFPSLAMLAAIGYINWSRITPPWLRKRHASRITFQLSRFKVHPSHFVFITAILLQIILVLPYYPYYFSYYNPLVGGAKLAARTVQVGWGEGLNEAATYLNRLPDAESTKVVSWYSTAFEPYFKGEAIYKIDEEKISRSAKPGLAADFVVFYVNQLQRGLPSEGTLAYFQQTDPIHTVSVDGQDYAWIFPAPGVSRIIGGEARLVGQAELLGFDWFDDEEQSLEAIPSGTVATLRLYWEWQGKSEQEVIRVSLVDSAGHTWGWGVESSGMLLHQAQEASPEPEKRSRKDGEIVVSDYALAVFPGTPPGDYYLSAWIEQAADGVVIGRFPLTTTDAHVVVAPPLSPADLTDVEVDVALNSQFEPLQLLGYNFAREIWEPGQQRSLELFWSSLPATSSAELRRTEVARLTLVPHPPLSPEMHATEWERAITPAYPTSRWRPGDQFRDVWPLTLPRHTPKGRYDLKLTVANEQQTIGQVEVGGRERLFETPQISSPVTAHLGTAIKFLGYELRSEMGHPVSRIDLTLFWQAEAVPDEDYTVFVQLLDANQQIVVQQDRQPQAGTAPTGTWAVGEIIPDIYSLEFEPNPEKTTYRLIAGLYRPETGERLPVVTAGHETEALSLTTFEIDSH